MGCGLHAAAAAMVKDSPDGRVERLGSSAGAEHTKVKGRVQGQSTALPPAVGNGIDQTAR